MEGKTLTRFFYQRKLFFNPIRSTVARRSVDMAKFVLAICCFLFLQIVHSLASEGKCIKGQYHKPSPSPETSGYKACHAFKESSCCTANFTVELEANETRNLYNHSWHRCGQLSQKCQQYWVMQVSLCADLLETSYPPGNHIIYCATLFHFSQEQSNYGTTYRKKR